jgi:alpha-glucosidase
MSDYHIPIGETIYQIYVRSFYDSDGNGVGDLSGIRQKLDYLKGSKESLGVDSIWLTPIYTSPMVDGGYDIADHCSIDSLFGTMEDFKSLLRDAHHRKLKVIVDIVPNHTSNQHPWFIASRSSVSSPQRDWYVWRQAHPDGGPPNNWLSSFGGSAWQFDDQTGEYYLHSFLKEQPDLNWRNPDVRKAMVDVVRFWLNLGVDGFRIDAVDRLAKDSQYRDEPPNPDYNPATDNPYQQLDHRYSKNGRLLYSYLHEIASIIDDFPGRFMITEGHPTEWDDADEYMKFYRKIDPVISAPINFEAIYASWNAQTFKSFIDEFQASLKPSYVPLYSLGNHDEPRLASRIGRRAARSAAVLQLSLPGTSIIYNGEELGLVKADNNRHPDDGYAKNLPHKGVNRDLERSPLPWDTSKNSGFTTAHEPWMPIGVDNLGYSVAEQSDNPDSFLGLYRSMLRIRHSSEVLTHGTYRSVDLHPDIFAFIREYQGYQWLVIINFSDQHLSLQPDMAIDQLIFSTHHREDQDFQSELHVGAHEALLLSVH